MIAVSMMSVKLAIQVLLKLKAFLNKGYDVIIPPHDVTSEKLSHDSKYLADMDIWPKFGNFSISMRAVQFLWEQL